MKKLLGVLAVTAVLSISAASPAFSPFNSLNGSTPTLHALSTGLARSFSPFRVSSTSVAAISVTNAQKLGLPYNTASGARVNVTDGFIASGFGDDRDGFYFQTTDTYNDLPIYAKAGYAQLDQDIICRNTAGDSANTWQIGTAAGGFDDHYETVEDNSVLFPWDGVWKQTAAPIVVTHPAVQQLAAPNTAQGGVYLTDPDNGTGGIYSARGYADDLGFNSTHRQIYGMLGQSNDDTINATLAIAPDSSSHKWATYNQFNTFFFYSDEDVETPDLVSHWHKASDNSAASITVTNVTIDDLRSGISVTNSGFGEINGSWGLNPPNGGRPAYGPTPPGSLGLYWDGSEWSFDGSTIGQLYFGPDSAFPFGQTFTPHADIADPPPPTITKSRPAGEANWEVVP